MINNQDLISMRAICKELFDEDNKDDDRDDFREFYKIRLKKVKEILGSFNITEKDIKGENNEYKIHKSQKENMKKLIEDYVSKDMRLIRKQKFSEIAVDKLIEINSMVMDIFEASVEKEKFDIIRNKINITTKAILLKSKEKIKEEEIENIFKNIETIFSCNLVHKDFEQTYLNESDKEVLINLYKTLLKEVADDWKEIVNIYSDMRSVEIDDISYEEYCAQSKKDPESLYENGKIVDISELELPEGIKDNESVLIDALKEYYETN